MSLYNIMNGVTPVTFIILPMLGKHPDEYPRFRDCFLGDEDRPDLKGKIHVYTRAGGGNRETYEKEILELRKDKNYITDYDDSFDSTFASFVFNVPEKWKKDFDLAVKGKLSELSDKYKSQMKKIYPKLKDKFETMFKKEKENA